LAARTSKSKWTVRLGLVVAVCLGALIAQNIIGSLCQRKIPQPLESALAQGHLVRMPMGKTPEDLYRFAWGLLQDNFYDPKFNGQDWSRWKARYDGKLKTPDDTHKAIETMVASLGDPYTRFLSPDAYNDEKQQIDAHLYGVGMQLGMKDHKVVIIAPIEGTPAFKAGVHSGDEIIEVDHKPVKGQSLDRVVKQIRGPKDTAVTITLMRDTNTLVKTMMRAEIPIKAVDRAQMLDNGIGYIRLDSFISKNAPKEMDSALSKLSGARGLVLDLRHNPGGLLSGAIEIANMFLGRGTIVSTIDNEGYKTPQMAAGSPRCRLPMVVLIDNGSASASEILSGALRDNGRAKLVGQKTFGKGLVQAINKLPDGAGINITIAKYLTPNDTDINKTGIIPEVVLELKEDDIKAGKGPWWWIDPTQNRYQHAPTDGKDMQLIKAIEVLKKDLGVPVSDKVASGAAASEPLKKN
jgi:carboxyl-terminal processing protease